MNRLILDDNLEAMRRIKSESVALIYLDPPFFSGKNYAIIWGDAGEIRSFKDIWSGGINHYVNWLMPRIKEMHRILQPNGSIFLHCDWHADSYIRAYILDDVFGENNLVNQLIWCYKSGSYPRVAFGRKHDTIWWYSKSAVHKFNVESVQKEIGEQTKQRYNKIDEDGRAFAHVKVGGKYRDYYLDEIDQPIEDWWSDIPMLKSNYKEYCDYPTQKPLALMERIIRCASDPGDLVMDPFMGGGSFIVAAEMLGRQWIGIDQSAGGLSVTNNRLLNLQDVYSEESYCIERHKYTEEMLKAMSWFDFESFVIERFGGEPRRKKGSDMGIDGAMTATISDIGGRTIDGAPIQVKQQHNVGRPTLDKFRTAAERYNKQLFAENVRQHKPAGYIIGFSFSEGKNGIAEEAARLQREDGIIIKLIRVDEVVPVARRPDVVIAYSAEAPSEVGSRTIVFSASAECEAGHKVVHYAWDFNYDEKKGFHAEQYIDASGRCRRRFSAGIYNIACKVVDSEGVENLEIITLKINGGVGRA